MVQIISNTQDFAGHVSRYSLTSGPTFCLLSSSEVSRQTSKQLLQNIPDRFESGHFGIHTSGSTGEPRLFIGKIERTRSLVSVIHDAQHCEPATETICVLPITYSYAFVNQLLWSHFLGRRFVETAGFSQPAALESALKNAEDAMICLVASQVPLFKKFYDQEVFKGVIRINFAGELFPQSDIEYLRRIFPNAEIFNNYGCTEALPRLTLRSAEESDDGSNIGRPLPGIELKNDSRGKLKFQSPYGAVASIGSEELHDFEPTEWIETGDLGEQLPDGSWRVTGRTNEVFKRFGEKVSISQVVGDLRRAWRGTLLGYPDADANGESAWALALSPEPDKAQLRDLLLLLRERYTRAHWPIRIESLEQIPVLPNGKPDLRGIRDAKNKKLHWRQRI